MRTFAVINQKGGCGKTTVSIHLAAAFAESGRRTLLVDMDPQGHCSLGLAVPQSRLEVSMAEALSADPDGGFHTDRLLWQVSGKLDLAPSTVALAAAEQRLAGRPDRDRRLGRLLDRLRDDYDLCIIDCPPNIGLLTFNALRAADEVIVPVETGYFALDGAVKQAATLQVLADRAGRAVDFHVLPTMYDTEAGVSRRIVRELGKHFGDHVLQTPIHLDEKLKEAASVGQPIQEYAPSGRSAEDFERLARCLLAMEPGPSRRGGFPPCGETREMDEPVAAAVAPDGTEGDREPPNGGFGDGAAAVSAAPAAPVNHRAIELVRRARELTERTEELHRRLAAGSSSALAEARGGGSDAQPPAADPPVRRDVDPRVTRFYGVRVTRQGTLFVQPQADARRVSVVGDFNGWSPSATPLERDRNLGVWQACVPLPPGRYRYRLVVDGRWSADPHNQVIETNSLGELNSVIEVG